MATPSIRANQNEKKENRKNWKQNTTMLIWERTSIWLISSSAVFQNYCFYEERGEPTNE
jgi:uncharacterized membrane protein YidH (DUF202 family)